MSEAYRKVDFKQAKEIMDSSRPSVLLDVRTEQEYIVEHAEGAMLFPLDEIDADTAARTIPDKDTAALVYCRTGRRSKMAADILAGLGYTQVCDIGSLEGWPYGKDFGI
jgi:phage shock protein E